MMNLICKFNGHKWKDGVCVRCGTEHSPHEWAPQPGACEEKCVLCGKIRKTPHVFSQRGDCEFVCTNCGIHVQQHKFVPAGPCTEICSVCGTKRAAHKWNELTKKRPGGEGEPVSVPGCRCTVCGAPNPAGEHAFVTRHENGERLRVCAVCGLVAARMAEEPAPPKPEQN